MDPELLPTHVALLETILPSGTPAAVRLPALELWPLTRELRVSGWTDERSPRRVHQVLSVPHGRPVAMCWRRHAELVVAVLSESGDTLLLGWTWDGEQLRPLAGDVLYRGAAGIVVSLATDPRTGTLLLLDAANGRLLELVGPTSLHTLVDAMTVPGLRGKRSLSIRVDPQNGEAATITVSSIPDGVDTVGPGDEFLQFRDTDPRDGLVDDWLLFRS